MLPQASGGLGNLHRYLTFHGFHAMTLQFPKAIVLLNDNSDSHGTRKLNVINTASSNWNIKTLRVHTVIRTKKRFESNLLCCSFSSNSMARLTSENQQKKDRSSTILNRNTGDFQFLTN